MNTRLSEIFQGYAEQPEFAEAMGTKVVLGEGTIPAALAVVGDAADDLATAQGHPFFGPSFQMLSQLCMVAGLPASCWFTNVVKLKPFDPEDRRFRQPSGEEIIASMPYLLRELNVVECEVVLALGTGAAQALTGRRIAMRAHHGLFFDGAAGRAIFVTHHPRDAMTRGPMKQELRADLGCLAEEIVQ